MTSVDFYMLPRRGRHQRLIESRLFNVLGVRFDEQYRDYRHTAGMFGPARLWSTIVVTVLLVAGSGVWRA